MQGFCTFGSVHVFIDFCTRRGRVSVSGWLDIAIDIFGTSINVVYSGHANWNCCKRDRKFQDLPHGNLDCLIPLWCTTFKYHFTCTAPFTRTPGSLSRCTTSGFNYCLQVRPGRVLMVGYWLLGQDSCHILGGDTSFCFLAQDEGYLHVFLSASRVRVSLSAARRKARPNRRVLESPASSTPSRVMKRGCTAPTCSYVTIELNMWLCMLLFV